jgi:DNA-directed RNA polymerase specialized sigma24 family protein
MSRMMSATGRPFERRIPKTIASLLGRSAVLLVLTSCFMSVGPLLQKLFTRLMLSFLKMNLSSREIAHILNITNEGVKKAKYRLRKKMDLDSDDSMHDVLFG